MPNWFSYGITQGHGVNNEQGVDIGTPYHTPLYFPYPGTIIQSGYGPWGGDIKAAITGRPGWFEEILHPDLLYFGVGSKVSAGQIVGLSGGQNSGGYNPATPNFSSGPHTEFDLNYQGNYTDPTSLVQALATGQYKVPAFQGSNTGNPAVNDIQAGLFGATGMPASQAAGSVVGNIGADATGFTAQVLGQGISQRLTGASQGIALNILHGLGFVSPSDLSQRILIFVLGAAMFLIGLILLQMALIRKTGQSVLNQVGGVQGAAGLAKMVAK